ncbi:DHA2 family efflux MFS transporter permease subunit [Actinokineospora xionganensis]|uniref:DHA2 family efflux MFS transporter permease subunit n=1 Tax=Actinokineospora xionganensis TaxID=2684470 RepID=A0ABR7L5Q6_9PSEU|nr:DHA2 family efflux MFS transporter permease subunit [Actinokineospora xionganensis]MBC6447912.1 DHA2 family efflux MFS transporter permease subunit [Actinokineospora xionganensis]
MAEPTTAPSKYRAIVLTACGGTFLAMLDSTVTNLAVPDLQRAFPSASVPDLSWVISGYAVMFAALLAPAGRLADALGRRKVFAVGVGLFTLASLLCALAPSLPTLVIARFLQGAGAAAMIPASLAILLLDGPAERRPQSIALWSTASAVAAALGPAVGGVLVEQFGWQSVFLINLPLGLIVIAATLRVVPKPESSTRGALPDMVGTGLVAIGVGGLTLAVSEGASWGWLDVRTLASAVIGVAALAFAVFRSRSHPTPAIETSLWGNRTFAATNIVSLFYGMAQYAWMLGSVLYLTEIWGYGELLAGVANTPGAFAASVAALGLARVAGKIGGPRTAVIGGLIAFTACGLWFTFGLIDHAAFLTFWLPAALLAGAGMGAATMGTSAAAAMSAPPTRFASSSGLNTTARQFGGALGIAMMAVVLQQSTGIDGTRDVDAYSNMFLFCTLMMIAALVVAVGWLKFPAPAAAPTTDVPAAAKAKG